MKISTIALVSLPVIMTTACTVTSNNEGADISSPPPAQICQNEALLQFVGQKATQETGAAIMAASGARNVRWAGPNMALTMDFRPDRVTISYDKDMVIERLSCG